MTITAWMSVPHSGSEYRVLQKHVLI